MDLMFFTLLSADADQPTPANLPRLSIPAAEKLGGKLVSVWLEVGEPVVAAADGRTPTGGDDQSDGREQGVILRGERPHVETGRQLLAVGELLVVHHPVTTIGGAQMPEWVELRVEDGRRGHVP